MILQEILKAFATSTSSGIFWPSLVMELVARVRALFIRPNVFSRLTRMKTKIRKVMVRLMRYFRGM